MKKTAYFAAISLALIVTLMFSCGGGGGGKAVNEMFTISYDRNRADLGTVPKTQHGDGDSPQTIQGNTGNLTKSGYLFDGWNTAANGSGKNYSPGASYKGESITLYAKWAAIFNVQVVTPSSPAPALDGVQRAPGEAYIKILSLTAKGRTLSNITIPFMIDGYLVTSIGSGAFQNCDFITELTIPDAVTNIESNAFSGCTGLSALTIPSSVTSIGDGAFSGCAGLNSIVLLTTTPPAMGAAAMEGCTATVSVPVDGLDAYKAAEGWNTYSDNIAGYSTYTSIVTFDGQGATTEANPTSKEVVPPAVTVGQFPTPPAKTGYNFGGWYKQPDGAGGEFTASTVVTENITVYAKWDEYSYTVNFDGQGATTPASPTSKTVASPNTTVGSLPTEPSKDGFYFGGWNTKTDGTGTVFNGNTTVTSDITVYAVWLNNPTFTVTFDGQGATTAANPSSKQVVSPATTVGELPAPPLKTGYIFGGWYNQPEGAGGEFSASTVVTKNTTVYAKWNSYSYTVTFNDQGATTPVGDASKTVTSPNTTVGTLPTEPVNTGYYFGGWNTKSDGSGVAFNADTQVTGDITVYAMWMNNPTFTVTFNGQGATTQANPSTKQVVSPAVTVGELPDPPLKTGYVFGGWYNQAGGAGGEFTASTVVTENTTVYAKWNSYNYTVTFDGQGATTASNPTSKPVVSPATTVVSLPTPPLKTGYVFGGWYNQAGGTGGEFTASTVVTADRTVYAKWNSYTYTVTFDSQGATTDANPTSKSVASPNTTINALPTPPEKDGFIFDGWYTQPEGHGNQFTNETVVESNITVYAKWIALLKYNIGNGITITGLTATGKTMSSIVIPTSIDGKEVTNIADSAFSGYTGLTSITIPDNVTSVGKSAFKNCSNLTTVNFNAKFCSVMGAADNYAFTGCDKLSVVNIGDNVRYIPDYAFHGCDKITSIKLPTNIYSIGRSAFYNCKSLGNIILPGSLSQIGITAFGYCTSFTEITIPKNVTVLDNQVFTSCVNLERITLSQRLKKINSYAFSGCSKLQKIVIPDSVTNIGESAFSGCTGLTSVTIPASVTDIGRSAFNRCTGLTGITIPESVTNIGQGAFSSCTSLTSITIPESVTNIGQNAFEGCSSLTSITIPDNVTSVGKNAFKNCSNLTTVNFNAEYCSVMGAADNYAFTGCDKLSVVNIGDNVRYIPDYAFSGCAGLSSITISASVTNIGQSAFEGCTRLTIITIPDNVTSIGKSAFKNCSNLTTLNYNVTNCSFKFNEVFEGCSLSTVNIGDNVTKIANNAFSGCISINISIPDSVTNIGQGAFSNCTRLTSITIPNKVTYIESSVFSGCISLVDITISNNVTNIGQNAFEGCSSLTSITIPDNVTSIGKSAFKNCSNLTTVDYNARNCLTMGRYVFSGCSNISTINIGNNVNGIPSYAFEGCTGLTGITIPDNVISVGDDLFSGCTGLKSLTIPQSVVDNVKALQILYINGGPKVSVVLSNNVISIGEKAFFECRGLADITIPESVISIGAGAFYSTSFRNITIPSGVTKIYAGTFFNSSFSEVTFKATTPPIYDYHSYDNTIHYGYPFNDCSNLTIIKVPAGSVSAYKAADGWKAYASKIVADE